MKYIIDIHGEIEGDYEILGKYEERPHGKWVAGQDQCHNLLFCSLCHASIDKDYGIIANYCSECGAYMKGGAE